MIYFDSTQDLAIAFHHGKFSEEETETLSTLFRGTKKKPIRYTECLIVKKPKDGEKEVLFRAKAICSPKETNYVKEVGRKRAIDRVLALAGYDKHQREAVWDAYNNRPRNP